MTSICELNDKFKDCSLYAFCPFHRFPQFAYHIYMLKICHYMLCQLGQRSPVISISTRIHSAILLIDILYAIYTSVSHFVSMISTHEHFVWIEHVFNIVKTQPMFWCSRELWDFWVSNYIFVQPCDWNLIVAAAILGPPNAPNPIPPNAETGQHFAKTIEKWHTDISPVAPWFPCFPIRGLYMVCLFGNLVLKYVIHVGCANNWSHERPLKVKTIMQLKTATLELQFNRMAVWVL